jgi:hypothetical protein
VVMVMVMRRGSEHRGSKHRQKQCSEEHLFHGMNVARSPRNVKRVESRASKKEMGPTSAPRPLSTGVPGDTGSPANGLWPMG